MTTAAQIKSHLESLPETRRADMEALHKRIRQLAPKEKLWFDTGKDTSGKTVTNPTIGYGLQKLQYADGREKDFFKVGISANSSGITVYLMGIKDKNFLSNSYSKSLGKATVTSYCIKFKKLADVVASVLEEAIMVRIKAD